MSESTIDKLSIEIAASSNSAAQDITELANSLKVLQSSIGDGGAKLERLASSMNSLQSATTGVKLGSLATALERIAGAISAMPTDTSSRLSGLSALGKLNDIKLSSTIQKTIQGVSSAVAGLPDGAVGKLAGFTSALRPLESINNVKIGDLAKLPSIMREFASLNISSLAAQMRELNAALAPLSQSVQRLSSAYSVMPKSMRSAGVAAKSVASANENLTRATKNLNTAVSHQHRTLGSVISSLRASTAAFTAAWYVGKKTIGAVVNEVNTYIENMNLFQASMGQYTQEATEFGKKVQDLMGIDFGEWARNQGVFNTLATGMGVTADRASVMSQQLTQLGYDIASFYNLDVKDAMLKLQSGLAGELEPLRRIGWDLSNARMNLELTKMGIEGNAQTMTQAEKVALRYKMIMEQVTITHGDMARTLASPANQIRVLRAQITLATRAIGNLFIPALNSILPVAIGIVKAIRMIAESIAALFHIDVNFEVDYSTLDTSGIATGLEETTDALDDACSAADEATKKVKEYQNTVMGFDELNKLNATPEYGDEDSGGNSGAGDLGGSGVGADFGLPTYDFLEGLNNEITRLSDNIAKKLYGAIKKITPVAIGVGTAIGAWKIARGLITHAGTLSKVLGNASGHAGNLSSKLKNMKLGSGLSSGLRKAELKLLGLSGALSTVASFPKAAMAAFGPWVAAIGLVAAHFSNLAINSENFQRGLETISGWVGQLSGFLKDFPNPFDAIGEAVKWVGEQFSTWWAGLELNMPWLENIRTVFEQILPAIQPVIDAVSYLIHDVFDIQWSDALMAAGIALAVLTGNPAIAVFLGVCEGISLAIRGIGWATSPVIEEVDVLAGVSEETASRFGTSIDSMEDAIGVIDEIDFANAVITEEDKERIQSDMEDVTNTILNNLDRERNEQLASLDLMGQFLTEEEKQETIEEINNHFDDRIDAVKNGETEITRIMNEEVDEQGRLTEEGSRKIREIQDEMYRALIETSGGGEEEIAKMKDAARNNEQAKALEAASNAIKAANEAYDTEIEDANRHKEDMLAIAEQHKQENGGIEDERYQNLLKAADEYYANAETAAEEHKETRLAEIREEVDEASRTLSEGYEGDEIDLSSHLDWMTGEVQTKGAEFVSAFAGWVEGVKAWWEDLRNELSIPAVGEIEINGQTVEFTGQDMGYYGGAYASGGFPTSGQLFMARENGDPELVGRMGRRTAVANNSQIVEGIEAGVTNAMLQVLPSMSQGRSGDVTMVLNVDSQELARATAKGASQAARRGQLSPQLAFI